MYWRLPIKRTGEKFRPLDLLKLVTLALFLLVVFGPDYYTWLEGILSQIENRFISENIHWIFFGAFFVIVLFFDSIMVNSKIEWGELVLKYEYKGETGELDLYNNEIEYNGFKEGMACRFSLDEQGIYLVPSFIGNFLHKPILLPWSILDIQIQTWRLRFLWIVFGRGSEVIVIKTKFSPNLRLRIKKGELKADFEQGLYRRAS